MVAPTAANVAEGPTNAANPPPIAGPIMVPALKDAPRGAWVAALDNGVERSAAAMDDPVTKPATPRPVSARAPAKPRVESAKAVTP